MVLVPMLACLYTCRCLVFFHLLKRLTNFDINNYKLLSISFIYFFVMWSTLRQFHTDSGGLVLSLKNKMKEL